MEEILIVEDDVKIQKLLSICLDHEGLSYSMTSSGIETIEKVKSNNPSLILLDIMLPDMDGIEVCKQIRMLTTSPILFMSCKSEDNDKILGLSMGADDYIEKPFNINVLLARLRAHLRRNRILQKERQQALEQDFRIHIDNLLIDTQAREVYRDGKKIHMTMKEFDLLTFLYRNRNRVFTMEELLNKIWGNDTLSDHRTVVVHISSLRKKVEEDPLNPRYIVTVRGAGYKFVRY
ncbi:MULTISPECIES: response regulator transcription factor [Paenibacillus]|uniref:Two-component system response regulator n=1 Tax=Paenibacillus naphthalenovorans TaxID=162209 RepID=A0A0U2W577_9BACL|nr:MULTISPECIES: response regulator transcription factor [Paenibacillus]ALS22573.1 two-component system response regulator [Paenibacillus naphthalenovorans]NTZ16405.1 response regulator transcription factor [Paenibacillus sp. JMULE4]GCL70368.1 DNA-binding response regulator [Paenibacillus naphthalenovorans]SDH84563.1 DNA-binding response regulator, OmpR family, contains REC and winged-helix (wHTH) domain [Paenibacillus naphthalenovorans]